MVLEEKCSEMLLASQLFMTQGELNNSIIVGVVSKRLYWKGLGTGIVIG